MEQDKQPESWAIIKQMLDAEAAGMPIDKAEARRRVDAKLIKDKKNRAIESALNSREHAGRRAGNAPQIHAREN